MGSSIFIPSWFLYPPNSYFNTIGSGEGTFDNFYNPKTMSFFSNLLTRSESCDNLSLPFWMISYIPITCMKTLES